MTNTIQPTVEFETDTPDSILGRVKEVSLLTWTVVVVGGFLGSVPLGLMMQFGNPEPLIALALPMMYGIPAPNLAMGWALHQFHGVALGLMYVLAVQTRPLDPHALTFRGAVMLAIAVGVITTAVLSVVVMPLWLGLVGYPYTPPFPDLTMPEKLWSVLGHVVYALPVTLGYALAARRHQ